MLRDDSDGVAGAGGRGISGIAAGGVEPEDTDRGFSLMMRLRSDWFRAVLRETPVFGATNPLPLETRARAMATVGNFMVAGPVVV